MRGAEAVIRKSSVIGIPCVVKNRVAKGYRVPELDRRLRAERTRMEARLLNRAKAAGVPCPTVLEVSEHALALGFIAGGRPAMSIGECREAGRLLAKLHAADIIHGDFTPANLISERGSGGLHVIDFGLGFVSGDVEDKAVDVFTMKRALADAGRGAVGAFLMGYSKYPKSAAVLSRVGEVEKRVRYAL